MVVGSIKVYAFDNSTTKDGNELEMFLNNIDE
jgi:hypothetical protein